MPDKVRPVQIWANPEFRKFLAKLQNDRIIAGKETVKNASSYAKLTKAILNFFIANKVPYKSLVEVTINGV